MSETSRRQTQVNETNVHINLKTQKVILYLIDFARRDAAVGKPRRELGGVVAAKHTVTDVEIISDQIRVPQVELQPSQRH